jgi:hypothetical protein
VGGHRVESLAHGVGLAIAIQEALQ